MFVRFRETARRPRLQASLIETRRVDGRVKHEYVASLGSVAANPSLIDRVKFWTEVDTRLARLTKRIGTEEIADIRAKIAERVAAVTDEEREQVTSLLAVPAAERRHTMRVAELCEVLGEKSMAALLRQIHRENQQRERRILRQLHAAVCKKAGVPGQAEITLRGLQLPIEAVEADIQSFAMNVDTSNADTQGLQHDLEDFQARLERPKH